MLYSKNKEKFNLKDFENPSAEYRATPFWAWNTALDKEELKRQIDFMKTMGYGGFHMHVRSGLETKYLSDEFMDYIKTCVDKAKSTDMLAWLYDEDRWPSGYAGGYVTENPEYRQRFLHLTSAPLEKGSERASRAKLIAVYDVVLDKNNCLNSYNIIDENATATGKKWYLYHSLAWSQCNFNGLTYADTLNPEAIEKFIGYTHEGFYKAVGDEFGKSVPAIFTDEPQFFGKQMLKSSETGEAFIPWTDRLPEIYKEKYGDDIIKLLPQIFWELPDNQPPVTRYRFHDLVAELFASSFADQLGKWCGEHNLSLTGHLMSESSLDSQSNAVGDAMRSYRSFQIPGIDMLLENHEYTTAKQAQSAAHQNGNEGMLSELDGVTNWDFDFRSHKAHGDWQAALGVTVRVPHLAWLSMNGEAKRDYPASINYQAAFAEKYNVIEDYFARVATALTRGNPVCKIAVIHLIESFWLHCGPDDKTKQKRAEKDDYFSNLTKTLLTNSLDFDFICEANLPQQCNINEITDKLNVGEMKYEAVVVPDCDTIRSTTFERLKAFKNKGGKVIFAGNAPIYIDAQPSNEVIEFAKDCVCTDKCPKAIVSALEEQRVINITENGERSNLFLYQLRDDANDKWLFVTFADKNPSDEVKPHEITVEINGEYCVQLCDCVNGKIYKADYTHKNGKTYVNARLYEHDSLMLRFTGSDAEDTYYQTSDFDGGKKAQPCRFTLCEPNVLLLDMPEISLDGGEFAEKEEILRADNRLRGELKLPSRQYLTQPWTHEQIPNKNTVTLRYTFESKIDYKDVSLALEHAELSIITLNGKSAPKQITGYFVDRCIKTVKIGDIQKGTNILEVTLPYGDKINLEAMYLLGNFGVYNDCGIYIDSLPDTLDFNDISKQGLLFYGGNLIYHIHVEAEKKDVKIKLPKYRGAMVSVSADGEYKGDIIYSPYAFDIGGLTLGKHIVDLKYYGTRVNTFGQLHKIKRGSGVWWGSDSWRSEGDDWTYDYMPWEQGIIEAPIVY